MSQSYEPKLPDRVFGERPPEAVPSMRPDFERQRMFCGPVESFTDRPDIAAGIALAAGRAAAQEKEIPPDVQQRQRARLGYD